MDTKCVVILAVPSSQADQRLYILALRNCFAGLPLLLDIKTKCSIELRYRRQHFPNDGRIYSQKTRPDKFVDLENGMKVSHFVGICRGWNFVLWHVRIFTASRQWLEQVYLSEVCHAFVETFRCV